MPSSLSELLSAIEAKISVDIGIRFAEGPLAVQRNMGVPRIVWVPAATGQIVAASIVGGNSRVIFEDHQEVDVHIWAADDEQIELITDSVIRAAQSVCPNVFLPGKYTDQTPDKSDNMARAKLRVLTISFNRLIRAVAQKTVRFDNVSFDTSDSVSGDGNLDAGES